jgi:5-methylcytosine-specific restriction endonuclease McrA
MLAIVGICEEKSDYIFSCQKVREWNARGIVKQEEQRKAAERTASLYTLLRCRDLCFYCGVSVSDIVEDSHPRRKTEDHVWPQSLGGMRTVTCCRGCNAEKEDMTPEEFRFWRFGNNRDRFWGELQITKGNQ